MDEEKLFDGPSLEQCLAEGRKLSDCEPKNEECRLPDSLSYWNNKVLRTKEELKELRTCVRLFCALRGYENMLFRAYASNPEFKLLPSIARGGCDIGKEKAVVDELIEYGRQRQWDKFRVDGREEVLFHLAIGRHLGLKCRLLDWTGDLDVAIAFALQDETIKEKTLWILALKRTGTEYSHCSPLEIKDDKVYVFNPNEYMVSDGELETPAGISRKILQGGFFTSTSADNLNIPLDELLKMHPNDDMELVKVTVCTEGFSLNELEFYKEFYCAMMKPCDPKDEKKIESLNRFLAGKK